jgi:hypothetical protein
MRKLRGTSTLQKKKIIDSSNSFEDKNRRRILYAFTSFNRR